MKLVQFFVSVRGDRRSSRAKIDVQGLGEVEIENVVTEETYQRIVAESITALNVRLGRTLGKQEEIL